MVIIFFFNFINNYINIINNNDNKFLILPFKSNLWFFFNSNDFYGIQVTWVGSSCRTQVTWVWHFFFSNLIIITMIIIFNFTLQIKSIVFFFNSNNILKKNIINYIKNNKNNNIYYINNNIKHVWPKFL
jgi:hypothetical protein